MIDAVWATTGAADGDLLVVPDGCSDLIWHGEHLLIAGPDRRARTVRVRAGAASCGVRLLPGRTRAAFGIGGEVLIDAVVPAEQVLGDDAKWLAERLAKTPVGDQAPVLHHWVAAACARSATAVDPVVAATVWSLASDPSQRVSDLAATAGYSERQLARRVKAETGHAPRPLARILRLRRAQRLADLHPDWRLTDLAHAAGYADHAHLARDCRELAASTPSSLLG